MGYEHIQKAAILVPLVIGSIICGGLGIALGCILLEAILNRIAHSFHFSRLFFVFAVRRIRKQKGMPEPVFAEDCRMELKVLADFAEAAGGFPDSSGVAYAVRRARRLLEKEMPA